MHVVDGGGNGGGGGGPGRRSDAEAILAQVRRIESTLVPVVARRSSSARAITVLANKMVQIIELLEQLDARLSR